MSRRTDYRNELDELRLAGWSWVAYLAFLATTLWLATPAGHALLVSIWSAP